MNLLIDADAFICMRKWSLLELVASTDSVSMWMTAYVARHELNSLQSDIQAIERKGRLIVVPVGSRSPAGQTFRELKAEVDKGEAESIAWATTDCAEKIDAFVSNDRRARAAARKRKLRAVDFFDMAVLLVHLDKICLADVRAKLVAWDDLANAFCRPKDYTTFDETWSKRDPEVL